MKLLTTIKNVLAMPGAFIAACNTLASATRENTEALASVTRENTEAVRAMHRDLLTPIKEVVTHTKYAADSQRRELQRNGHPHAF